MLGIWKPSERVWQMNTLYVWGDGKNTFQTILSWPRHWSRKPSLWKNWRSWKTLFQKGPEIFGRAAAVLSRIRVYAQSTMGSASPALQAVTAYHAHTAPSNVYWKCGISRHALWSLIKYTEQACWRLPNTHQCSWKCSSKQITDVWQFRICIQNLQIQLEQCCWVRAKDCKTMRLYPQKLRHISPVVFQKKGQVFPGRCLNSFISVVYQNKYLTDFRHMFLYKYTYYANTNMYYFIFFSTVML